jgi:hypothetical protein
VEEDVLLAAGFDEAVVLFLVEKLDGTFLHISPLRSLD